MKSTVTILIVARNEEENIKEILSDIQAQTYPHDLIDIIFVDSNSTDSTKAVMTSYTHDSDFKSVRIFDNPKGTLAPGWNIGLRECVTDYIVRVDAHASITPSFIEESVKLLDSGEYVVGGPRPNVINPKYVDQKDSKVLLAVESALFGSGFAYYRNGTETRDVSSVFHGMFRREIIDTVGFLNESLGRTEDNDYYYRVREKGYKIKFSPKILSHQYVRESFKAMRQQKYNNGYWIGKTLLVNPKCISLFHMAPMVLVLGTLVLFGISFISPLFLLFLVPYFLLICLNAILAAKEHDLSMAKVPKLTGYFIILHFLYGYGTVRGLMSGKN